MKEDSIGIEIKFNIDTQSRAYSHNTKRNRVTKQWKNYKYGLISYAKKNKTLEHNPEY